MRCGWTDVFNIHSTCVSRKVESELLPALKKFGIRFYAYSPVRSEHLVIATYVSSCLFVADMQTACGMLTGKYKYSDLVETPEDKKNNRMFADPKWSPL